MSLTGIFKNMLLVVVSVLLWHTEITPLQLAGYSVSLCGLVFYSIGPERVVAAYDASKRWFLSKREKDGHLNEALMSPEMQESS